MKHDVASKFKFTVPYACAAAAVLASGISRLCRVRLFLLLSTRYASIAKMILSTEFLLLAVSTVNPVAVTLSNSTS